MMILVGLVLTVLFALVLYKTTCKFNYWKLRGVPFLPPIPFFGNYKDYIILNNTITHVVNRICDKFREEPYIGAFYGPEPTLIVKDPEHIKLVLAKDFYYFNSRENGDYATKEIITGGLFLSGGDRWKVVRQHLTPFFSSAKMKKMFYLIEECTAGLEKLIEDSLQMPKAGVRSMMARFTIDCIGSCAFGVNINATSCEEKENPFCVIGRKIFEPSTARGLKLIGRAVWPDLFYKLGFQAFPSDLTDFFENLLKRVFHERGYKHCGRHDFVDLVLGFKESKYITGDSITSLKGEFKKTSIEVNDSFLSAQCVVLFGAAFETTATTLTFLLYELAKNPDKQKRAIEEVDLYFKNHDRIEYECVYETPYLDACVCETLRIYPVLGVVTREVVEDYTLPSGVPLTKGVRVHIPVHHLHHNPEYFPEPDVFRPERFLGAEKGRITPFTYMPFGEGPRTCIGLRFAKMQSIAGLLTLLRKCQVELVQETPTEIQFEPRVITTQPVAEIYLKFTPRLDN
ncbi:cytochrome P450 6B2-like [Pieris napi]|uniref:cytochrome P450 6B2-like n=1 Tax=Pieris napi TaxID=78633 RepID=UPI001FBB5F5E|nr:cytochrome P450 6B2-like [Pieris napi]